MSQWAYEMSNADLLQAFARACAEAGVAISGFVLDPMGPLHADTAHYLKGVLLARLEGIKPPFSRDDIVQSKSEKEVRPEDFRGLSAAPGPQKIRRIYYEGSGKWLLEFEGVPDGRNGTSIFLTEKFSPVPSPIAV